MIIKITKGGISTIQNATPLGNGLFRIDKSGLIINTNVEGTSVSEASLLDMNDLTEIDNMFGEVILYAIRYFHD